MSASPPKPFGALVSLDLAPADVAEAPDALGDTPLSADSAGTKLSLAVAGKPEPSAGGKVVAAGAGAWGAALGGVCGTPKGTPGAVSGSSDGSTGSTAGTDVADGGTTCGAASAAGGPANGATFGRPADGEAPGFGGGGTF